MNSFRLQEELLLNIYEWFGFLCSITFSGFTIPAGKNLKSFCPCPTGDVRSISTIESSGLILPSQLEKLVTDGKELIKSGKVPWLIIGCWGFQDSPVSWGDWEHDIELGSGENDYIIILLPNDKYLQYASVGPKDAYN
jgi:hypothetical protein